MGSITVKKEEMNPTVKQDILAVLKEVIGCIDKKDFAHIKELSNHTIHNASIYQDNNSIAIAIIIYSLSKIIERQNEYADPSIIKQLGDSAYFLEKNNLASYRSSIKRLFDQIASKDSKLKMYIEEVVKQAQIKKGTSLYEHGLSMAQAGELLGVSQWELMNYIGKTRISDIPSARMSAAQRLGFAKKLFGIK